MKKILSLSVVMIKSLLGFMSSSKSKDNKMKSAFKVIGFVALFGYLSVIVYFASRDILKTFVALNQTDLILNLVILGTTIYTLVIALLSVPSIFYFSKDVEILLALPLKPFEILAAKTLTTYVSLLAGLSFLMLPFGVAYYLVVGPPIYFIFFYLLASLVIPIIPLAIAIILIVVLFTYLPKAKSKDGFTYASTFLSLALVLYINTKTTGSGGIGFDPSSTQQVSQTFSSFIPTVAMLTKSVNNFDIVSLGLSIILSIGLLYALVRLISPLYFKGAIGISETSKKTSKRKVKVKDKDAKIDPLILTLIKTDVKNILRTPLFAINYLLSFVLLPAFMIIPLIGQFFSGGISIDLIKGFISEGSEILNMMDLNEIIPYAILISFTITFFLSLTSSVSSTAISREGERMSFYKSLPVTMMSIIDAKILIGIILSVTIPLIVLIGVTIIFSLNIVVVLLSLITIILTATFSSVFDIVVDVYKPKLLWDNENQAIKQNFMIMIPMFSSMLLLGVFIFVFMTVSNQILSTSALLVILPILSYLLYSILIKKYGLTYLDRAIEKV